MNFNIYRKTNEKDNKKLMLIGNKLMFESVIFNTVIDDKNRLISCFELDKNLNYYMFKYDNNLIQSCKKIMIFEDSFKEINYKYDYKFDDEETEIMVYDEIYDNCIDLKYVFDKYYNVKKVIHDLVDDYNDIVEYKYLLDFDEENQILEITLDEEDFIRKYKFKDNKVEFTILRKSDNKITNIKYKFEDDKLVNIKNRCGIEKFKIVLTLNYKDEGDVFYSLFNNKQLDTLVFNYDNNSIKIFKFKYYINDLIIKILNNDLSNLTLYNIKNYKDNDDNNNLTIEFEHINI